ncbi:unnamed protein product [Cyclocybe aegerita]|uniref:Nephrocystin 3-like N-terminal domain-containing protein n=1 Tax=Cyclocybe aegerita TaxID=1973307 RepID=A0A8S0VTQ3_CYCAE|nr:unnamed protein product [Cyclocybe aegerita]
MFSNSRNVLITGGTLTHVEGSSSGIEALYSKVAPGAFHNSGERVDAPKCHPNTRLAIQREILQWLEDPSGSLLMWMYGPAGGGKTAVAQTIAQICFERGWLSAAFFFSRRGDSTRSDEGKLVPTLAYQLAKHIPETRPYISSAVLEDPSLFDLSIQTQIRELILTPLRQAASSLSVPLLPRAIIIDGLDECLNQEAQVLIVEEFTHALQEMQQIMPHKLIIASRPEQRLAVAFEECDAEQILKRLSLDSTWQPDDDIKLFFLHKFAEIRRRHPLGKMIKDAWPSEADINTLVRKSSGQFIFASTVVSYVSSRRHHPVERLKIVRGLTEDPKNPPFAELDSLYRHILLSVEDRDLLLVVLRVSLMSLVGTMSARLQISEPLKVARYLSDLPDGAIELLLNDLSSVLAIKTGKNGSQIDFHHASFPDFLLDQHRAKEFYVNDDKINGYLAKGLLSLPLRYPEQDLKDFWSCTLTCPLHFLRNMSEVGLSSCHALGDVDLEAVLHIAAVQSRRDEIPGRSVHDRIVKFIRDIQLMDASLPNSGTPPLSKLLARYQTWVHAQLRQFFFNGFDNDAGIDITIFSRADKAARASLEVTSSIILARVPMVLHILATALNLPGVPAAPVMTDDMVLCWKLMHFFRDYFDLADLCGVYAMTAARSAKAACLCMRYLMTLNARDVPSSNTRGNPEMFREAIRSAIHLLPLSASHSELVSHCCTVLNLQGDSDLNDDSNALKELEEQEQRVNLFRRAFSFCERFFRTQLPSDEEWTEQDKKLAVSIGEAIVSYLYRIYRWEKRQRIRNATTPLYLADDAMQWSAEPVSQIRS